MAKKAPRDRELPGLEHVRYGALDRICSSIAEIREEKNRLVKDEADDVRSALKQMKSHNLTVYKHDGVELVLVPGDEKLRVRVKTGGGDTPEAPKKRAPKASKPGPAKPTATVN